MLWTCALFALACLMVVLLVGKTRQQQQDSRATQVASAIADSNRTQPQWQYHPVVHAVRALRPAEEEQPSAAELSPPSPQPAIPKTTNTPATEIVAATNTDQARNAAPPATESDLPEDLAVLDNAASDTVATPSAAQEAPRNPTFPEYNVLHVVQEYRSSRLYGEVLATGLAPDTSRKELKRVAQGIAKQEGLNSLVLYRTHEARLAHYSMEYADQHPNALENGLLCFINNGWFRQAGPKDWGSKN